MLMVIFGAGASYDSSADFRPCPISGSTQNFGPPPDPPHSCELLRPPLANALFHDPGRVHGEIVQRYSKLLPILPRLRQPLRGRSVEEELESLQEEANGDVERRRQLFSVRYYLQELIFKVSQEWLKHTSGVTNYVNLIDQIRHHTPSDERIALVTFNYDYLLDKALLSFSYNPQNDLERHFDAHPALKLFRPHGSVEWSRFVDLPKGTRRQPFQLIEQADNFSLSDKYVVAVATRPEEFFNYERPIVPAIAIPVQRKTEDTFEWPESHRRYFEELLPQVTKILIIGWQAREAHFSQVLRRKLPRPGLTHMMVVGRDEADAWTILKYFSGEIGWMPPKYSTAKSGFSDFVLQGEGELFFKV
jgi:hypothetical protein